MSKASFVLNLKEARYLHETEWLTKQDPFAVIWTTSSKDFKVSTKTCKNGGKRATWEETFTLTVDNVTTESFFLEIMNKNGLTQDRLIGRTKFACSDIEYDSIETWVKIYGENGADAGEVKIAAYRKLGPGQILNENQVSQKQQEAEAQVRLKLLQQQQREEQERVLQQQREEQQRVLQQQREEQQRIQQQQQQREEQQRIQQQQQRDDEKLQLQRIELLQQQQYQQQLQEQLQREEEAKQRQLDDQRRMEQQRQQLQQESIPMRNLPSPSAPSSYFLPPGWTSAVDPASNRIYYVNQVTHTTQWESPTQPASVGPGPNMESLITPMVHATLVESPTMTYQPSPLKQQLHEQLQHQQSSQMNYNSQYQQQQQQQPVPLQQQSQRTLPSNPYLSQQSLLSPLPPGWSQKMTAEGRPYYFNHISEKTTWDRP